MKKTLMTLTAMAAMCGFAGQDDLLVTLTVNEKLAYKDSSPVVNDRVALVWTPTGVEFKGFYADGTLIDGQSQALAFINVKDGAVGTVAFQISAARVEKMKLTGGSYALYLLDTRGADKKPVTVEGQSANTVAAVNYFVKLVGTDAQGGDAVGGASSAASEGTSADTIVAQGSAELPFAEITYQPIIKSAKVEDGKFKVTIENAVPYMGYGLAVGTTPAKADMKPTGEVKTGLTKEIVLEYPIDPNQPSAFIQATAGRNQ